MPTGPSPDVKTLHTGDLDALVCDLVAAGFRPVKGDRHTWIGPITPALSRLTSATEMRIEIRDGWPYLHPYLFVDGLVGRRHVNSMGNACLWPEDEDNCAEWLRLDGIERRAEEWVADQEAGAPDPALDSHLYFATLPGPMVTVDIEALVARGVIRHVDGGHGLIRARLSGDVFSVGEAGNLDAAWFSRSGIAAPPADASALQGALTRDQKRTYDLLTARLSRSRPGVVLLLWNDGGSINALGVRLTRKSRGRYESTALEVARTDRSMLRLRSGPDAPTLAGHTVAVFGVGAIGSEVALLVARSGVGRLVLVDRERLRPANMSRHAASGRYVGMNKSDAMAATIHDALSDVRVTAIHNLLWSPDEINAVVGGSDLVIDATGNRAYRDLLSRMAAQASVPLVSTELHRAGAVARARVQVSGDHPIWARTEKDGFPEVPAAPGPPAPPVWETGCGAPVNNAPPAAVAGAATLGTRAVLDVLTGRNRDDREILEVYEPIEAAPFDRSGQLVFRPTS